MNDLISRKAAINAPVKMVSEGIEWVPVFHIKQLPSAEPERKKGKWISKGYGEYRCSSCRNIVDLDEEILMSIKMFDYCPVCGAEMEKDNE